MGDVKNNRSNGFGLSEQVLNQIPTTVMAVDADLNLVYLNDAGQKLIGKKLSGIKGKKCYELFNSEHCNTDQCRMVQSMNSGEGKSARNQVSISDKKIPIEYFTAPQIGRAHV